MKRLALFFLLVAALNGVAATMAVGVAAMSVPLVGTTSVGSEAASVALGTPVGSVG